jgi:hypothetical protein
MPALLTRMSTAEILDAGDGFLALFEGADVELVGSARARAKVAPRRRCRQVAATL